MVRLLGIGSPHAPRPVRSAPRILGRPSHTEATASYCIASSTFATNSPITRPLTQRATMTKSCSGSQ